MKTIIGKKLGMTQIFSESGEVVPVSVIQAGPCYITALKSVEKDGYSAVQLGFEEIKKSKNISKPRGGQFAKNSTPVMRHLHEFRFTTPEELAGYELGKQVCVDAFVPGDYVDVTGYTRGRGFSGVIKRHRFNRQPVSHGASDRVRAPGTSGRQLPQRVIKGTRKPGHYGHEKQTVQRLEVVIVDKEKNILGVKGSVPGPTKSLLHIRKTIKKVRKKIAPPPPKKKVQIEKKKK